MNYQESLDWLYSTQNFGIKLGLDAPRHLLRQFLANPKRDTQVIHVAGTNGKGSTCALIDSVARATGLRCGLFTSPHLVDYRERIRVNGAMISRQAVAKSLTELRDLVAEWEHHPTFFELTLAVAMLHFKQSECDLIILETGMGGRLDATTAVPADVCVITPIALDHSDWLGDTLEKVAYEKAGIIVEKKPIISAMQDRDASIVIAEQADQMRAPLTVVDQALCGYPIALTGQHQAHNAALALEAVSQLGIDLNYDTVHYGLSKVRWPGRFETLSEKPLTIIDGAHNPHAAAALVATWQQQYGGRPANLIFGAVESKDIGGVLSELCQIAESIHLVPIDSPRSLTTEQLAEQLPPETSAIHYASLEECLQQLDVLDNPRLIAGSLFLIGQAKALFQNDQYQSSSQ